MGKNPVRILEAFKLQGISSGIEEKEGRLLAGLTDEPSLRRNQKFLLFGLEMASEFVPVTPVEDQAKVACRDRITIDHIAKIPRTFLRPEMGADLVTSEVEIDPLAWIFSTDFAAEDACIETSGLLKVINGKGEMKSLIRV